jgi:hypothetical protein
VNSRRLEEHEKALISEMKVRALRADQLRKLELEQKKAKAKAQDETR